MGYLHIDNLYRDRDVLLFSEVYALEKIHGTSAHVRWTADDVSFFSGEQQAAFEQLFDKEALAAAFAKTGFPSIVVHGECYGGKVQGQSHRYGKDIRFVAFDVKVDNGNGPYWLNVPYAERVVKELGLEFVSYTKIPTTLAAIDAERDSPSVQSIRNGIVEDMKREGVVLRPLIEATKNNGERIIAKHKGDEFKETKAPRVVGDKAVLLENARAIAEEWVTPMRLEHVLQKFPDASPEQTKDIITAMLEDVRREGAGEFVDSKEASKAICNRAAVMFLTRLKTTVAAA